MSGKGVKIKGVTPVVVPRQECEVRENGIRAHGGLRESTDLNMVSITEGTSYLQYFGENLISDYQVYLEGAKAQEEGYDAVQPDCIFDPAIKPLKEALDIPVVGPLETSVHLASLLGRKFSVIVNDESMPKFIVERVRDYGMDHKLASVRVSGVTYEDLGFFSKKDENAVRDKIRAASIKAIEEDGADCIILACTSMFGHRHMLQEEFGVPILEPGAIAAKFGELLVDLNLAQSKRAYPRPQHRIIPEQSDSDAPAESPEPAEASGGCTFVRPDAAA
ncbi:MAG: hypothetical protein HKO62_08220 [Gammaproteobacteria bacterium]|nr:hypothetical protein [Gammaproteobacteria bacterium]